MSTYTRRRALAAMAGAALAGSRASAADDPWATIYPQILKRIQPPKFPNRDFDVTRFGARPDEPNQRKARAALGEMVEKGTPVAERKFGEGGYLRPMFVQPYRCTNVQIQDITIVNSPMYEMHPVLCRNVTVRNVTVSSHGP